MGYLKKTTPRRNTIYKNGNDAKYWNFRKRHAGKAYYFNLGPTLKEAKNLADQIDAFLVFNSVEEALVKFNPNKVNYGNIPTIEELIEAFKKNSDVLDVKQRTVNSYASAMRRFVKNGYKGKNPTCMINWAEVWTAYRRAMLKDVEEEDVIMSRKRTCNSVLRNAKSLVSDEALPLFKHWDMSWVERLQALKPFKKVGIHYSLPPEELVLSTFDYFENVKCNTKFVMLGLALHAGMRRGEIAHCRRSWFDLSGDEVNTIKIVQDKKFDPKGHAGTTFIKPYWAQRLYARADGLDYLFKINFKNHKTIDTAFEPLIADLRALGWDRNSPLHECRKLYGAYLATTDSLFKAQKCLRHSSPQITSDTYADIIVSNKILNCWDQAA